MFLCLFCRALLRAPEQISDTLFGIPACSGDGQPGTVKGIQACDVTLVSPGNCILCLYDLQIVCHAGRETIASLLQLLASKVQIPGRHLELARSGAQIRKRIPDLGVNLPPKIFEGGSGLPQF